MIDASGYAVDLEADGGIKAENAKAVAEAGATILVMGTEIFGSIDYAAKIADVRRRLDSRGLAV
jgi:ribulose-phosphate 3-epimerase